ncbi:hypothetical protein [Microbacterium ginsengisoli]|jgi:hypothetical protein
MVIRTVHPRFDVGLSASLWVLHGCRREGTLMGPIASPPNYRAEWDILDDEAVQWGTEDEPRSVLDALRRYPTIAASLTSTADDLLGWLADARQRVPLDSVTLHDRLKTLFRRVPRRDVTLRIVPLDQPTAWRVGLNEWVLSGSLWADADAFRSWARTRNREIPAPVGHLLGRRYSAA